MSRHKPKRRAPVFVLVPCTPTIHLGETGTLETFTQCLWVYDTPDLPHFHWMDLDGREYITATEETPNLAPAALVRDLADDRRWNDATEEDWT